MKILLVRHGEPNWSPGGRVSNDPALTHLGRAQADRLVERRWGHVDRLWVSPYLRSRQTAHPLEQAFGMEAEVVDWMAEIGPAEEWDGSPYDEVAEQLRKANGRSAQELWHGLPGAESFHDFHDRVTDGLRKALGEFGISPSDEHGGLWDGDSDVNLVLVAHGGTNAVVTGHLLGVPPTPWEWDRFDSAHTSVVTLVTRPVARRSAFGLVGFGDVTHLDADMVTR